jgi:dipeptidyl aminopeptidase/acylaminoacyl peptidase
LTFSKGGESGVAWSPDSRRIAFSARREGDEVGQVYVLDVVDGGEAVRITSLSTGARSPQWRPDGKAILFVSTVYPGAVDDDANKKIAAERKAQKYRVRVYEKFPIRNWDKWLEDTQAHLFIQDAQAGAKAKDLLAGSKLAMEGRCHSLRRVYEKRHGCERKSKHFTVQNICKRRRACAIDD